MTFIPKPHEIYKHFKGNLYQIVTIAQHSETGEQLVIYQAMYGDFKTYARPLAMFTSEVDKVKYPEIQQRFRFELQGADADRQTRETDAVSGAQGVAAQPEAPAVHIEVAGEEPALDPLVLEFLDADSYEQKRMLRSLMNIRRPQVIDAKFLTVQDEYLRQELEDTGITRLADL